MTTMEDTGVGYNDEEDKDANGGNDGHGGNDPVVDEEARTTSRTTTSNNNKASANKTSELILPNDHVRQFVSFLH